TVRCNPPEDVLGKTRDKKMVHFHGLWQKNFPRVSAKCRRLRIPYVVSPHGMLEPWAWRHKWWKKRVYFQLIERRHLAGSARLVVVGDGSDNYVQNLRRLAEEELGGVLPITWVGGVWDHRKWTYLQAADLMCLPSHSENFGLVILEALQVGTPVVTTDQTPWSELPGWGGGWIVRPGVEPLTEALAEFFSQPRWTAEQRTRLAADIQNWFS